MANLNKVMLIGRLTRDPEMRTFPNGGKVASFGFAVNNPKKDQQTGQWVQEPCFVDVKAYNRDTGRKLADVIEQYVKKGHQAFIEGHLVMESWEDKNGGGKRSKLVVVVDNLEFLEPRSDGGNASGGEGMARAARPVAPQRSSFSSMNGGGDQGMSDQPEHTPSTGNGGGQEEEIPF
jgi:single-strand DNA-binding protein